MKTLQIVFKDNEHKVLEKAKKLMAKNFNYKLNWHNHFLILAKNYLKNHIHEDIK